MPDLRLFHNPRLRKKVLLVASLCTYCSLLSIAVPRHEAWADEAQAWQIARSNSLLELFRTAIHFEASPGLWHAILWMLARVHFPYAGLSWFCAAIAVCGVCLILFASPLPFVLRLILPFTYFFAFQYSVVARSYVLFAPILFCLATIWSRRAQHPILFALLLGLLANVSAHGLVTAVGLIFVLVVETRHRLIRERDANHRDQTIITRDGIIAMVLLFALLAFALWCMIPPPNANWLMGATVAVHSPMVAASRKLFYVRHPLLRLPAALQILLGGSLWIVHVLSYGVSQPSAVAWLLWALLLWRWYREKTLRYIAPVLLLIGLCIFSRFSTYHAGLVWILLLFLWWVTWPANSDDPRQLALIVLFGFCMISQLVWTERVVGYDMTHAYSPDRGAAPVLQQYRAAGKRVDIATPSPLFADTNGYYSVGLEPYFASEPFNNAPARYWIWRPHPAMYDQYVRDTEDRSVVVMLETVAGRSSDPGMQKRLSSLRYRKDAMVCGQVVYPRQRDKELCHVFYIPD